MLTIDSHATVLFAMMTFCSCAPEAKAPPNAPAPRATEPKPVGDTGLSADQVRAVVVSHQPALMACYITEGPKDSSPKGVVTVRWRVDPAGSVSGATIVDSTLGDDRVQSCILRQVQSWRFPSSDAISEAEFPFAFGTAQ
jgi:hypothetical protein